MQPDKKNTKGSPSTSSSSVAKALAQAKPAITPTITKYLPTGVDTSLYGGGAQKQPQPAGKSITISPAPSLPKTKPSTGSDINIGGIALHVS